MREKAQTTPEATSQPLGKLVGWLLVLGVYLAFNTFLMGQKDLENSLAPFHMSLLVLLGAFLFGARCFNPESFSSKCFNAERSSAQYFQPNRFHLSRFSLIGIALASGLLSLGFSRMEARGVVLGLGWPALIAWSSCSALRGGL